MILYILMKQVFKDIFIDNIQEPLEVKKSMTKYQLKNMKEQIQLEVNEEIKQ